MNIKDALIKNDKWSCCGCSACAQKCSKHCITMAEDEEGFLYPQVDVLQCNDCGVCNKVCPVLNSSTPNEPLAVYAAMNANDEQRQNSSSGGMFVLLAEQTIRKGGVVFGARFNNDWEVEHGYAETLDEIKPFMRSKYVQSRIGNSYNQAEAFLKQGREVLFVGTSCQIRGLHIFLRQKYEKLITVDVICHGVPSPAVWRNYLKEIKGEQSIGSVNFRAKQAEGYNWKDYGIVIKSDKGEDIVNEQIGNNVYMQGFLNNMYLRPSCHNCKAKEGRSCSDITLADYWRIWEDYPDLDDQQGTSLLVVNTVKGEQILAGLNIDIHKMSLEHLLKCNTTWKMSPIYSTLREMFFEKFHKEGQVCDIVKQINVAEQEKKNTSKRIGIITYWQTFDNYGQTLQALSLQYILREMGHEPFLIRYNLDSRWEHYMDEKCRQEYIAEKNKDSNNGREFNDFRIKHLDFSPLCYNSLHQLQTTPPDADVYIAGSDQIWGLPLDEPENKVYWCDFGPKETKRIAYAPSFGSATCPPHLYSLVLKLLMRFSGVSCREYRGIEMLKSMGIGYAEKVLDPTMLPSPMYFHSICDNSLKDKIKHAYIYVYSINITSAEQLHWNELKAFAIDRGWDIVVTTGSGYTSSQRLFDDCIYVDATVPQWLWLIRNANLVVTPSFHGIVFSLQFHTLPIFVPLSGTNSLANDRVLDLFCDLGIENHVLTEGLSYYDLYAQKIDWTLMDEYKTREKTKSLAFLERALINRNIMISIITFNYNNAKELRRTIESVVSQTSKDFEYIVIDAHSTDESCEIINGYKDGIDYWISEPAKGMFDAMNKGIAQAKGKYCLFLNAGDVLCDENVIANIIRYMSDDECDYYVGNCICRSVRGTSRIVSPPSAITVNMMIEGALCLQSVFTNTLLLKQHGFDIQYKLASDWKHMFQELINKNASYKTLPIPVSEICAEKYDYANLDLYIQERKEILDDLLSERIRQALMCKLTTNNAGLLCRIKYWFCRMISNKH